MDNNEIKIGLVAVGYQCDKYLRQVLAPWVSLKCGVWDEDLGVQVERPKLNIKICCTTALFKEYNEMGHQYDNERTESILSDYKKSGAIDEFIVVKDPIVDHQSRNYCLDYFRQFDIDLFWQLDLLDEIYTQEDILSILGFVRENRLIEWYRINFKNYVGDTKHYIEGFNPPRIHWAKRHGGISRWHWDNNVTYNNGRRDTSYPHLIVPPNIACVKHYSWCGSDQFLKNKINYQKKCLGTCSYLWDERKGLVFNQEYYNKTRQLVPELKIDE